jgi:hypothetical protein
MFELAQLLYFDHHQMPHLYARASFCLGLAFVVARKEN